MYISVIAGALQPAAQRKERETMAEIKPFKALRFTEKAGAADELVCPPYDIISEEERQAYLRRNPHNVIRLELPRPEREGEDPYAAAGSVLDEWLREGFLAEDDAPALYIYEEAFTAGGRDYAVRGFICRVKLEEFSKGVVLPHEETLSKAKADRFNLMNATGCNFSQIYSLYMDETGETRRAVEALSAGAPEKSFTDAEGVTHRRLRPVRLPQALYSRRPSSLRNRPALPRYPPGIRRPHRGERFGHDDAGGYGKSRPGGFPHPSRRPGSAGFRSRRAPKGLRRLLRY